MNAHRSFRRRPAAALVALAGFALAAAAGAQQQILLDKPVRAGELIAFPDLSDPAAYYYVVDKPHLATLEDRPQFSFLRWVSNVRTGAGEEEAREGEGGGIVHALVSLSVSRDQLREAERELQRARPGARLRGPVIFKSGKFGLVTSFLDPELGLSRKVVGLGNAPLLDGEKAAVSMLLTKPGANILWQSFHGPTPDISFTFEMEVEGYQSPKRAKLEADFDQIYDHQAFGVGLASTYLAAEIRGAFDDLRRTGAIKLTEVGEDEDLDQLVNAAYGKLIEIMFQPVNGTGSPDLAGLSSAAGGQSSLLDRATTQLQRGREEARAENERRRTRNRERRTAEGERSAGGGADARATAAETRATDLERRVTEADTRTAALRQRAQGATGADATHIAELVTAAEQHARTLRELATEARAEATRLRAEAGRATGGDTRPGDEQEELETVPSFAIVAAFEMKKVHQSGRFVIDLNKYTTTSLTLRFDENIGDLSRLVGDDRHFRQVNLDDPFYRQREILASLDGTNSADFGDFVNFVTVQMRKRHAQGDETLDEIRIDRANFSREGNAFKLLYGWKGDNDRRRWLDYEYRTEWSFFGDHRVEVPWRAAVGGAINLAPPYQRRQVTFEADPGRLADAGVRAVTVRLFYRTGESEGIRQATLNPATGQLSAQLEFLAPADRWDYEYEVSWRLSGNRTVSSGRLTSSDSLQLVDELPGT